MGADRANRFNYSSYLNGEVQFFRFRESVVARRYQIRLHFLMGNTVNGGGMTALYYHPLSGG
ncbi:MAG: hypothetical protein RLZZ143_1693 [Cyanobacteriota bacterium]|jgi:hypothetical protein